METRTRYRKIGSQRTAGDAAAVSPAISAAGPTAAEARAAQTETPQTTTVRYTAMSPEPFKDVWRD